MGANGGYTPNAIVFMEDIKHMFFQIHGCGFRIIVQLTYLEGPGRFKKNIGKEKSYTCEN